MEQYVKVLKSYKRMAPELELSLRENVKQVIFRKNDVIQEEGVLCDHIYFIERGVVRGFFHEGRRQQTVWFKKENEFIISISEDINEPDNCTMAIEALEDCLLWAFPVDLIDYLTKHFPEFNHHLMIMMMKDITKMKEHYRLYREELPSLRYDYLRRKSPDLFTRVPVKHLASFVGISEKAFEHMGQNNIHLKMSSRRRVRPKD
jgi:CRP-like cAMP-binding protein